MIDPLSCLAIIKSGISAGKQLHSMSKDIAQFFDSVDGARAKHSQKKRSLFASANEEAMNTFMAQQQADDAEEELRIFITNSRGISAYRSLQNLRRQIRVERKEEARLATIAAQDRQAIILSGLLIVGFLMCIVAASVGYLWYLGWIKF